MNIVLFEDSGFRNLLPLAYFRPVWDLRLGSGNLRQFIAANLPDARFQFLARDYLHQNYLSPEHRYNLEIGETSIFLNGRWYPEPELVESLGELTAGEALFSGGELLAFYPRPGTLHTYVENGVVQTERVRNDYRVQEVTARFLRYPWDFIFENGKQIQRDFNRLVGERRIEGTMDAGVHLLRPEQIYLAPESRVMPGVVLAAEQGPIWIDRGARVMPNAVLEGPLYLGPGSLIKAGAKIYQNTSIGPVCKVGGEVEETIIQEYSNKQHEGFLGHAFLGAWVNIGADTNNSDLKNNYGEITVFLNGYPVPTGKQFLGLIMGDHSKTAINTMFNTGTVVGVSCNVYGEGFPPKFIPSFSWGGSGGLRNYSFEKSLAVAQLVMKRRQVPFTDKTEALFRAVRELALNMENRARVRG